MKQFRKIKKKILSGIITLAMVAVLVPSFATVAYADTTNSIVLGNQDIVASGVYTIPATVTGEIKAISITVTNAKLKLSQVSGTGFTFKNGVVNSTTAHSTPNTSSEYLSVQLEVTSNTAAETALASVRYVGVQASGSKVEITGSPVQLHAGDYYLNGHYYTLSSSGTMSWKQAMEWAFNLQTTDSTRYPGFKSYPVVVTSVEENQMLVNIWGATNPRRQVFLPAVPVNPSNGSITVSGTEGNRSVTVVGEPVCSDYHKTDYGHGEVWKWMDGTPEAGTFLPNETGVVTKSSGGTYWAAENPTNGGMVYFGHPSLGAYWDDLAVGGSWGSNVWSSTITSSTFYGHMFGLAEWEPVENVIAEASKVIKPMTHTHSFSYGVKTVTATNDTIGAYCTETIGQGVCGHQGSSGDLSKAANLTLTADDAVYTGGVYTQATYVDTTAWTALGLTVPAIQYVGRDGTVYNSSFTAPINVGKYTASITTGGVTASANFEISKKQLTVSGTYADDKTYDGTTTADITLGTVEGIVGSDNVIVAVSGSFSDKNVGTKDVPVSYSISGTSVGNYIAPDDDTIQATISPIVLTVEGTSVNGKVYDGTTAASANCGSLVGVLDGETVTVSVAGAQFGDKNVGTDKDTEVTYQLGGADQGNYTIESETSLVANITPKPITVVADSKSSYVESELETLTYSGTTLCEGDSYEGALTTDADKMTVGQYDILQGTLTAGDNYEITFTKGTYTVAAKIVQNISFEGVPEGNLTKTYGDGAYTEQVTGPVTTVTYESSDPEIATVDPDTGEVTILKAGEVTITAKAAETAEYAPAQTSYILTINKAKVVTPVAEEGLMYNGTEQTGVVLPDGALYTLADNTGTNAGNSYVATATLNDPENYEWDLYTPTSESLPIAWSISKRGVTITSGTAEKTYDGYVLSDGSITESGDGFMAGEGASYTITGFRLKAGTSDNEFTYELIPDTLEDNYYITTVFGTLTVNKITTPLVITANSKTAVYTGEALTDNGYTFTEGVLTDTDQLTVDVKGSITGVGASVNRAVSYKIMNGGEDVTDSYTIERVDGTLIVQADPKAKVRIDETGLVEILKKYKDSYGPDAVVKVALLTDGEVPQVDKELVMNKSNAQKAAFYDASLWLYVNQEPEKNIGAENDELISVTYEFSYSGIKNIRVYRVHTEDGNQTMDELKSEPNEKGEYVVFNEKDGVITVVASKYSTYAFTWDEIQYGPATGDKENMALYLVMMFAALATIAAATVIHRKRRGVR